MVWNNQATHVFLYYLKKSFNLIYSRMIKLLSKLDDILVVEAGLILRICDQTYFITSRFSKALHLHMYMGNVLWKIFCICTMQTLGDFVINLLINVFITKSLISLLDIKATASITMFLRWKKQKIHQDFLWVWTTIRKAPTLSCTNMKEYCW